MEKTIPWSKETDNDNAIETLCAYLDKGIDDMEAGNVRTVDEAFQIIKDRMKSEL